MARDEMTAPPRLPRPLAVVNAGPLRDARDGMLAYCGGDNDVVFARALGLAVDEVVEIRITDGAPLPASSDLAGVLVTGSAAMITERHPWAELTARWLVEIDGRLPVLGVCFGHQLVAHAYGGRIDWTPEGSEYGTVEIERLADAAGDPLFAGLPERFHANAAHSQCVTELPAGARMLARNRYGVQAARFAGSAWGVQFHPEFDKGVMDVLFDSYGDYIGSLGLDARQGREGLQETPVAASVLRNFATIVRAQAGVAARGAVA